MADKHGPVFSIRLGSNKVLVVSSWEMAKECFTVHDKVFSTRPNTVASRLLTYDSAMFGFAPYEPYWREMRKIATVELLSSNRIVKTRGYEELEYLVMVKYLQEEMKSLQENLQEVKKHLQGKIKSLQEKLQEETNLQ
ncbi:hypothetical protein V6N12_038053 [Hibiscus sabdariffa]